MDLIPDDTLRAFTASVEDLLTNRFPTNRLRQLIEDGDPYDGQLWKAGTDLGWQLLAVPECLGGSGATVVELGLLCESLGRWVASGPWIGTAVVATLLGGLDGYRDELAAIASGERRYGLALPSASGTSCRVVESAGAQEFLLLSGGRARLCELPVASSRAAGFDPADYVVDVDVALSSDRALACSPHRARQLVAALTAATAAGVAGRCVELSVRHAGEREQFGRPIGAYQAIKHRCADMAMQREVAVASTYYALATINGDHTDAAVAVASAVSVSTDAAVANAENCVQVYGAMGFTWECDAHLYLKRAHRLRAIAGALAEEERKSV